MRTHQIELFSEGSRLVGIECLPDRGVGPFPVIVQPPGFLGLAAGPVSAMYHERFTAHGYAVVSADYRGFGDSEGERGWVHPGRQLEDLISVVNFVTAHPDKYDVSNIFCYGHGGTGGGNAVMLAAVDSRIGAVACQTPVSDGREWLRRMRTESEWQAYLSRVDDDLKRRATEGEGEIVDPREEIMVATPERKAEATRKYADSRTGTEFHLASAALIMRYRPLDVVDKVSPRPCLFVSLEGDVVTPPDIGAEALYERARPPKKIIRQSGVSHYDAYRENVEIISEEVIAWFEGARQRSNVSMESVGLNGRKDFK